MDEVRPFPSLRAEEEEATNDGGAEPLQHTGLVVAVARLHGKHHRDRGDDEDEGHEGHVDQRVLSVQAWKGSEDLLADGPCVFGCGTCKPVRRQQPTEGECIGDEEEPHHHFSVGDGKGALTSAPQDVSRDRFGVSSHGLKLCSKNKAIALPPPPRMPPNQGLCPQASVNSCLAGKGVSARGTRRRRGRSTAGPKSASRCPSP